MTTIPQEIKDIKQWTYSYDLLNLKRPKHSHFLHEKSLSYDHAFNYAEQNQLSFGFYVTPQDKYILGDVDHVEDPNDPSELPIPLLDLLKNKNTYSEVSPSGEGIRFVFKLPSVETKERTWGSVFYTRFPLVNKQEAQINLAAPWQRFTGIETTYSSGEVAEVTLEELDEAFKIKWAEDKDKIEEGSVIEADQPPPNATEMKQLLHSISLDQGPRVIRAYQETFKEAYSHYMFWLRIMMGMHNYASITGTQMECLQEVVKWSRNDPTGFEGEDDVINKWQSFSAIPEADVVSYHTVMAMAHYNTLQFPRRKAPTKEQAARGLLGPPMPAEYANFQAMIEYFGIKLHCDIHSRHEMYVTGDEDVMKKFFESHRTIYYYEKYRGIYDEKNLTSALHVMCQAIGFIGISRIHVSQHLKIWMFQIRNEIDLVKMYFDTPYDELPLSLRDTDSTREISTVEYMFGCLTIDHLTEDHAKEEKLYFKYYKSWLMGFVRNMYMPKDPHINNCVLLLTGKEQIRKTSHFGYMFPRFMREDRIAFTPHGFSNEGQMRDVIKLSSSNSLLVWDEIEQYITQDTESNFKKIIDGTPQKFIDKYETVESKVRPVAIYGATSNQRELKLSDTGSRRIFHIPVSYVDTNTLDGVNWWSVVNDLKHEIMAWKKGDPPWLLTPEELAYQAELHKKITTKSGLELQLMELFQWSDDCILPIGGRPLTGVNVLKNSHFMSTSKIITVLQTSGESRVNRAHLVRVLHKLCGDWTKTTFKSKVFSKPKMVVTRGMALYSGVHELWVVPLQRNPYN